MDQVINTLHFAHTVRVNFQLPTEELGTFKLKYFIIKQTKERWVIINNKKRVKYFLMSSNSDLTNILN